MVLTYFLVVSISCALVHALKIQGDATDRTDPSENQDDGDYGDDFSDDFEDEGNDGDENNDEADTKNVDNVDNNDDTAKEETDTKQQEEDDYIKSLQNGSEDPAEGKEDDAKEDTTTDDNKNEGSNNDNNVSESKEGDPAVEDSKVEQEDTTPAPKYSPSEATLERLVSEIGDEYFVRLSNIIDGEFHDNLSAIDTDGRFILHKISLQNVDVFNDDQCQTIAKVLLSDYGFEVNTKDSLGKTPLHYASCAGRTNLVDVLIEKGADVNAVDEKQQTALHGASHYGNLDVAKKLLKAGADPDLRREDGKNAMEIARDRSKDMVHFYSPERSLIVHELEKLQRTENQ